MLHQPFSSPRCWLVQSVRRQRPAGQAEFCSKSYTFRVTFPKVNHPAKNMEKEKRKVKLKKTQELKNETTLVTQKNFTFASSSLTLFCFVQGVQFNFEGERQHHSKEAPTPKTRRRENNTPTREREEANNTQKEEENSTTQEGKTTENSTTAKNGRSGKTTPPKRRTTLLSFTSLFFTLIRFHSDTVQFNSKRDAQPQGSGGRDATPPKRRRGKQHHPPKTRMTTEATFQKVEGERERNTTRRNEESATPPKKGKQHHTKQKRKCNTNQSSTAKKGKREESRTTHNEESYPQLYFYLLQFTASVTKFDLVLFSYIISIYLGVKLTNKG